MAIFNNIRKAFLCLLLIFSTFSFAQNDKPITTFRPNVNRDAKELIHYLSDDKTAIHMESEFVIFKVEISNPEYRKQYSTYKKEVDIDITEFPLGMYTVSVWVNQKIIVFNFTRHKEYPEKKKSKETITVREKLPVHEVDTIVEIDTIRIKDIVKVRDTVVVREKIPIREVDTIVEIDTIRIKDLVRLRDTITLREVDTLKLTDTIRIKDFVKLRDTITIREIDTIGPEPTRKREVPLETLKKDKKAIRPEGTVGQLGDDIINHKPKGFIVEGYWIIEYTNGGFGRHVSSRYGDKKDVDAAIRKNKYDLKSVTGKRNQLVVWEVYDLRKFYYVMKRYKVLPKEDISGSFNPTPIYDSTQ